MTRRALTGPNQVLTTGEAAVLLGLTSPTVARRIDAGKLTGFRTPGGHRRIRMAEIQAVLDAKQAARGSSTET